MIEKPSDCNCDFPEIMCRNLTGHSEVCPSHHRIMAEIHDTKAKLFPPLKPDPTVGIQYALDVNDKYLKRMESLLFQNSRLRSVLGEAIGVMRVSASVIEDDYERTAEVMKGCASTLTAILSEKPS